VGAHGGARAGGEGMTLPGWLWAIPVFGLMIFAHELGHFLAAKFFGIRVHEFALGLGPAVAGFTRGETRYNLRAVPFGGFVRMAGMDPDDPEEPGGLYTKPLHARALTFLAGPLMNLLLASLMFSAYLYVQGVDVPVLGRVSADCGGQVCPAPASGLQPGDRVLSVGGSPVDSWTDIVERIAASEGAPLEVRFERGGRELSAVVTPAAVDGRYVIGARAPRSLWKALALGPAVTADGARTWAVWLWEAVTGRTEAQLTGPVGMTRAIAAQASAGLSNLLWVTGVLSLNLGLFNLLPIPALDGAHLLFMAVEAVRGRRLDPERVNMVHFVGFLLLMGLMLAVTCGDLRAGLLG